MQKAPFWSPSDAISLSGGGSHMLNIINIDLRLFIADRMSAIGDRASCITYHIWPRAGPDFK